MSEASSEINAATTAVRNRRVAPAFIIAGILLVYIGLGVGQIFTKQPMDDEAWFASPSLNLITKGYMGTSILYTNGLLDHYTFQTMPLYYPVLAGWFKVVGISLASQRTLSLLWGFLLLGAWYFVMESLFSRSVALLTLALIGLDALIIRTAALGRMDMMCAALGFAGYAVYLQLRGRNLRAAILISQALVAASGLTHPNGLFQFLGLLYLTISLDRERLRLKEVLVGVLPYVVGAFCWSIYILQDPRLWYLQLHKNFGHRGRGPNVFHNLLADFSHRFLVPFGFGPNDTGIKHVMIVVIIIYFAGLVTSLLIREIRTNPGTQRLYVLLTIPWILLSFQADYNPMEYTVHYLPVFAALLAVSTHWWWTRRPRHTWVIASGLCLLFAVQIGALCYRIWTDDYHKSYLPAVKFVKQHSDDKTVIMGSAILAFEYGFRDNLVDDVHLGFGSHIVPAMIVVDPEWALQFDMIRRADPDGYGHIRRFLEEDYKKVYERSKYQVYVRKGDSIPIAMRESSKTHVR